MPNLTLDNLFPSSFKGATFLTSTNMTRGGRKTITHEFINSDRRFVEDIGGFQRVLSIRGIITGPNYISKKDALLSALESKGLGVLSHSTFGNVECYAKTYTLTENLSEVNKATFDIVFERSDENIFPDIGGSNISVVTDQSKTLLDSVSELIGNVFGVTPNFPFNFKDALFEVKRVADFFYNHSNIFGDIKLVDDFYNFLNDFNDSQVELVQDPVRMGEDLEELFLSLNDISDDPQTSLDNNIEYFSFGIDDEPLEPLTVQRQEQITNRETIQLGMRVNSLALAYRNASLVDYEDTETLRNNENILEEQYVAIVDLPQMTSTVQDNLKNLRDQFRIFAEDQRVRTSNLTTIETNTIPMTVLAYRYYGDIDNVSTLIRLNPEQQAPFVSGEVTILTA